MMDDEKLISLVKKKEEIYNRTHPLYRYQGCKKEAWEYIARKMDATEEDCLKRWTNLRDRFTRECRINGNTDEWPYRQMKFLIPHIVVRQRWKTKLSIEKEVSSSSPELDQSQNESTKASSYTSPVRSSDNCKKREFTQSLEDPQIFEEPLIDSSALHKQCRIPTNAEVDRRFCEAVENLKKACVQNDARNVNPAVYAFGEMIVATICKMNSRNQIKVMQQVTDLVMRVKLEEDEQAMYTAF